MEVKYDAKFLINQFHIEMYNSLVYSSTIQKYLLIPRDRIDITQNAEDVKDATKDTMIKTVRIDIPQFSRELIRGWDWSVMDKWRRIIT